MGLRDVMMAFDEESAVRVYYVRRTDVGQ